MKTLHAAFILSRILVGGIFMYTGLVHLADMEGFSRAITAYDLLPLWSVKYCALILPWTELLAGLAITTGMFLRAGSLITSLLLVSFTLALSVSLYRGLDISCGCFSTSPEAGKISGMDLVRDFALLASSSFLFLYASIAWQNRWKTLAGTYGVPALTILLVSGTMIFQMHTRNPCENVTLETINRHRSFPSAVILSKRPVQGICEVLLQMDDKKVAVYAKEDFLVVGEMFREQASLTREGFIKLTSRTFLEVRDDLDQAIVLRYTPDGTVRNTLYMFSSPGCPHCHQALVDLMPILEETDTGLNILLVAQGSSKTQAAKAACLQMDVETYLYEEWMDQAATTEPACEEGEEILKKAIELGAKLDIRSVPTFFTQDGIMVTGSNMQVLEKILKSRSPDE